MRCGTRIGARHDRPAEIDERKGFIQPGHSELTFNGQLSHNDGLLIQAYCQTYSFGYKKAVSLVEKDVEQLLVLSEILVWYN